MWVSRTKVIRKGVSVLYNTTANRSSNTDRTGRIRATTKMVEHYSQIQMLLPTLIGYSQSL